MNNPAHTHFSTDLSQARHKRHMTAGDEHVPRATQKLFCRCTASMTDNRCDAMTQSGFKIQMMKMMTINSRSWNSFCRPTQTECTSFWRRNSPDLFHRVEELRQHNKVKSKFLHPASAQLKRSFRLSSSTAVLLPQRRTTTRWIQSQEANSGLCLPRTTLCSNDLPTSADLEAWLWPELTVDITTFGGPRLPRV